MPFVYNYVVSLGPTCQAGMQAKLFFPRVQCLSVPFTFQTTPFETLVAYFKNDFRGFMDETDLGLNAEGVVENQKYGTTHPHEFPNGLESYRTARSRHDFLCKRFRNLIRQSKKGILFLSGHDAPGQADVIMGLLRIGNPKLSFRLLTASNPLPHPHWAQPLPEWQSAFSDAQERWAPKGVMPILRLQGERLLAHLQRGQF